VDSKTERDVELITIVVILCGGADGPARNIPIKHGSLLVISHPNTTVH